MDQFINPGNFTTKLRCFSAPFFQGGDAKKIQELNFGGKVTSCLNSSTEFNDFFADFASELGVGCVDPVEYSVSNDVQAVQS